MLRHLPFRLRQLASERGQAAVEFALVLPILCIFVLGALYLGRLQNYGNESTQLAGEGARLAAVDSKCSPKPGCTPTFASLPAYLQDRANQMSTGFHTADSSGGGKICVSYPAGAGAGDPVTVTVTVNLGTIKLPLVGSIGIGTRSRSATMRLEQTPSEVTNGCSPP